MAGRTRDMTAGKPWKLIVGLALPLMMGNVFQQMYTIVDTAILGNAVGVEALAAVGAADWLNWFVLGVVSGLTQGFSILVSQRFGAGDWEGLRKAVAMSTLMAAALAVVMSVASQLAVSPMLRLLDTPPEVVADARIYLRICYGGIAVVTAYNLLASVLRAMGDGRAPLVAMIIAALINVALDIVFVVFFHWGVAGAAAATVIAQVFSCIFCIGAIRRIPMLALGRSDFALDRPLMARLLRLGTPMAFQNAIIAVGGVAVQRVVNGFGTVFIAGYTATNKLYGLLELAATSFGFSMASFTGQNLGAKKYRRIQKGMRSAFFLANGTAIVIAALMLIFGRWIVGLFISDTPELTAAAVEVAYTYLKVMSWPLCILYMLHIYRSALQGMGDTVVPMLSGIMELIMRVAVVIVMPRWIGEYGVYLAEVAAWFGAAVLLAAVYYARERQLLRMADREAEPA